MDDSLSLKILVVGDSGVGKTSLLTRICSEEFTSETEPTVGCDIRIRMLKNFQGHDIRLQLWEAAGQDRYATLSRLYMRGALGVIVVTDVTDPRNIKSAVQWKEALDDNQEEMAQLRLPVILLQNKMDLLVNPKENPPKDYQSLEKVKMSLTRHNFTNCFQVSAKSNSSLDEIVEYLADKILKLQPEEVDYLWPSETRIGTKEDIEERMNSSRKNSLLSSQSFGLKSSQIKKEKSKEKCAC